jgi:predicted enzyme related to lactoylglutathione lyase
MSEPSFTETGRIVWHDLMTVDLEQSKAFYGGLFGWTTVQQEMGPMGTYNLIQHQGQGIGGMVPTDPRTGVTTHWLSYITVGDVDDLCKRMPRLGGTVAVEPRGVTGAGRFAILQDPNSNVFSAIQIGGEMPGPSRSRDHGSFYWNQLLTRDNVPAKQFYGEVCGWTLDEYETEGEGDYGVFKRGDEAMAGMLSIPHEDPRKPGWLVYIAVDEIDETVERV